MVVDASAFLPVLIDDGPDGGAARGRLAGEHVVVPELFDLEVVSVLRTLVVSKNLSVRRAQAALADLDDADLDRVGHRQLVARIWQLRANLTAYDAAYVALAEALRCPLVTADGRLARSPGPRCPIEVLRPG